MMADASLETMDLIRSLDTEKLDIADISDLISSHLNHLAWMFNSATIGVLLINGHTAYIINWLESKLKNFTVSNDGTFDFRATDRSNRLADCKVFEFRL